MIDTCIPRALGRHVRKAADEFTAVIVIGSRQSGKTALLTHLFGGQFSVFSLEPQDVRLAAKIFVQSGKV